VIGFHFLRTTEGILQYLLRDQSNRCYADLPKPLTPILMRPLDVILFSFVDVCLAVREGGLESQRPGLLPTAQISITSNASAQKICTEALVFCLFTGAYQYKDQ
jgi:hypothetical protein